VDVVHDEDGFAAARGASGGDVKGACEVKGAVEK
jgi:hypothetical protein